MQYKVKTADGLRIFTKVKERTVHKAITKANPGKNERRRMKVQAKSAIIAANFAVPLKDTVKSSGTMFSRIALAKDLSPFSVAHAPALGAGQGKDRKDKSKPKSYKRFSKSEAKQVRDYTQ